MFGNYYFLYKRYLSLSFYLALSIFLDVRVSSTTYFLPVKLSPIFFLSYCFPLSIYLSLLLSLFFSICFALYFFFRSIYRYLSMSLFFAHRFFLLFILFLCHALLLYFSVFCTPYFSFTFYLPSIFFSLFFLSLSHLFFLSVCFSFYLFYTTLSITLCHLHSLQRLTPTFCILKKVSWKYNFPRDWNARFHTVSHTWFLNNRGCIRCEGKERPKQRPLLFDIVGSIKSQTMYSAVEGLLNNLPSLQILF